MIIKTNDVFFERTNAKLINRLFGKNYAGWQSCIWPRGFDAAISDNYFLWMVRFNVKNIKGWRNTFIGDMIKEEQLYEIDEYDGYPIDGHPSLKKDRLVMFIEDTRKGRKYIFKGVYRYNKKLSTKYCHYYDKVSDEVKI